MRFRWSRKRMFLCFQQYPPPSTVAYGGYNSGMSMPSQPQAQQPQLPPQAKQPQSGYMPQGYPPNSQQGNYAPMMGGPPGPQSGYMGPGQQTPPQGGAANPHRLFSGRGYRPRQPSGPGYQ